MNQVCNANLRLCIIRSLCLSNESIYIIVVTIYLFCTIKHMYDYYNYIKY